MEEKIEKRPKNTVIRINDKYQLVFDSQCMWLEEFVEQKKGKNAGKIVPKIVSGYLRTLPELIVSLETRKFREMREIADLKELAKAQEEMHAEIRELCRDLQRIGMIER